MSQPSENPFPFSNTNKRYHTFDYACKRIYGKKVAKIPLEQAGATCPNIDGTKGRGGCIYCKSGSLSCACERVLSLREQFDDGVLKIRRKWNDVDAFIPYLQSFSNTYCSPEQLDTVLCELASYENAVEIALATRADCLPPEIVSVLAKWSEKIPVTVELGLQSASDETATAIRRGHTYQEFEDGFARLRRFAPKVKIGIHIINGLPNETAKEMIKTAHCVALLHPDFLKIHLLYVVRGTALASLYEQGKYVPMEREDYIDTVCRQLEILPPDIVVERLTGDGAPNDLLAPLWSVKKTTVLNDIDKKLVEENRFQGIFYQKED